MNTPLRIKDNRPGAIAPAIDWDLMPKPKRIPSEAEIVGKFSYKEALRHSAMSQFLARLAIDYARDEVVFWLKRKRLESTKKHCRLLTGLFAEMEKKVAIAVHHESEGWLKSLKDLWLRDTATDRQLLDMATLNELLRVYPNTEHRNIGCGVNLALLIIGQVKTQGQKITDEVAKRADVASVKFNPAQEMVLIESLLIDIAEMLNVRLKEPSAQMVTGMNVLINKYLKIIHND